MNILEMLFLGNFTQRFLNFCCLYDDPPAPPAPPAPSAPPAPATFSVDALNGLNGESFHAVFPEDIRAKPYMKDVNTFGDFVKKFDNAQTMIGKPVVPAADASQEEWDAFNTKAGKPKTAAEYVIAEIEGVPKEFLDKALEVGPIRQIMHEAGLSGRQGAKFAAGFLKTIYAAETAEKTAADERFSKLTTDAFGQHKQAIIENGRKFLDATLPDTVRPFVNELDEKALAVVIAATDAIVKKHVNEDGFKGKGTPPTGSGVDTQASIQAEMSKIMADPAYRNAFADKAKNIELNKKMEDLRTRLRAIAPAKI